MSNEMKKRVPKTNAEILRSISESDVEAELSEEELNAYLRENGVDPSQVVRQVRAKVEGMLQEPLRTESAGEATDQTASPIAGLVKEGNARGLSIMQLAAASGLSLRLFAKLDSGMLEYASIPLEIISDVSRAIGRAVEDVRNYLQRARPNVQGASFRADVTPVAPAQLNFFLAVAQDDSLTPEQLERLRALEEKYKSKSPPSSQVMGSEGTLTDDLPPPSARLRAEVRDIADEFADAFKEMKRRGD